MSLCIGLACVLNPPAQFSLFLMENSSDLRVFNFHYVFQDCIYLINWEITTPYILVGVTYISELVSSTIVSML
jgi:hypothetical protein